MVENPFESPRATDSSLPKQRESWVRPLDRPASLFGAVKQGAWLGFKWTTYIIGPLAVLALLITLVLLLAGAAAIMQREGESILTLIGGPFGFYAVSCLWGIAGGVVVCVVTYLIRRAVGRK